MSIHFKNYDNVQNYKNRRYTTNTSFYANKMTIIRGAITVGLQPKSIHNFSKEVLIWKTTTILAFIDNNTPITIKNISLLERSEKVTIGYFIGMAFAQIHMQKVYNVRHLMHLLSDHIEIKSLPGVKKTPDLWGFNNTTGESFLIEAKGSTRNSTYFNNASITKAEAQLNAILEIKFEENGCIHHFNPNKSNLTKFIIATHPNNLGHMVQHVIDPENSKHQSLNIDGDLMIYEYYINIIKLMFSNENQSLKEEIIEDIEFQIIDLYPLNYSVGILKEIFKLYNRQDLTNHTSLNASHNFYSKVTTVLDEFTIMVKDIKENDYYSIGIDGIIVKEICPFE